MNPRPSTAFPWCRAVACFRTLLLLLLPWLTVAVRGDQEGDFKFLIVGAEAQITGYLGPGGNVVIPDHLGGKPVTSLGYAAFLGSTSLTNVTIPNSVADIGSHAFTRCTSLASVAIPSSVILIAGDAFSGCTSLISLEVDELNPAYSSTGGVLFDKGQSLLLDYPKGKTGPYVIPNSVTHFGRYVFAGCTNLTDITIPGSVTAISGYAFAGCTGLTNVTIPNSVTRIEAYTFRDCVSLASAAIPSSVTTIEDGAFFRCKSLTSVTIPGSVAAIGGSAFIDCTGLTNVTIGNSVTNIGNAAFAACTNLTDITIPGSVTAIGSSAFANCPGLTSVIIPNSVITLGAYAFQDCTSLASVLIPTGMTAIADGAFFRCKSLANVTIPGTVTIIGVAAFRGCTSLTSVSIPSSVTAIADNAFSYCSGLVTIAVDELNPAYSSAGGILFNKTQSVLVTYPAGKAGPYVIPNHVTSIQGYAFSGCTGLTALTIPNSVTFIRDYALAGCKSLSGVYFEGNAVNVGPNAFDASPFVTVFFRAGTAYWGSTYARRPTALWEPRPSYSEWATSAGLTAQFPDASAEGDDPDRDGSSNHDEWLAGTDPAQAGSRLELELVPRPEDLAETDRTPVPDGQHALHFRSVPGRYYGVQTAARFGDSWELQGTRIASATQTRFVVPNPAANAFYRVLVLP